LPPGATVRLEPTLQESKNSIIQRALTAVFYLNCHLVAVLVATYTDKRYMKRPLSVRAYAPARSSKPPPGAAPGPPVKTAARVRRFRGCNKAVLGTRK